jgi:hypothetical protein
MVADPARWAQGWPSFIHQPSHLTALQRLTVLGDWSRVDGCWWWLGESMRLSKSLRSLACSASFLSRINIKDVSHLTSLHILGDGFSTSVFMRELLPFLTSLRSLTAAERVTSVDEYPLSWLERLEALSPNLLPGWRVSANRGNILADFLSSTTSLQRLEFHQSVNPLHYLTLSGSVDVNSFVYANSTWDGEPMLQAIARSSLPWDPIFMNIPSLEPKDAFYLIVSRAADLVMADLRCVALNSNIVNGIVELLAAPERVHSSQSMRIKNQHTNLDCHRRVQAYRTLRALWDARKEALVDYLILNFNFPAVDDVDGSSLIPLMMEKPFKHEQALMGSLRPNSSV